MSRTRSVSEKSCTPASARSRLASRRAEAMSFEKPGRLVSWASDIARLAPGRINPPTYFRKVEPCSRSAAPQRSIASEKARRTRGSSNGFLLVLKTTSKFDSHGLSLVATRSPNLLTSSSRCVGVTPRNSAIIRPLS